MSANGTAVARKPHPNSEFSLTKIIVLILLCLCGCVEAQDVVPNSVNSDVSTSWWSYFFLCWFVLAYIYPLGFHAEANLKALTDLWIVIRNDRLTGDSSSFSRYVLKSQIFAVVVLLSFLVCLPFQIFHDVARNYNNVFMRFIRFCESFAPPSPPDPVLLAREHVEANRLSNLYLESEDLFSLRTLEHHRGRVHIVASHIRQLRSIEERLLMFPQNGSESIVEVIQGLIADYQESHDALWGDYGLEESTRDLQQMIILERVDNHRIFDDMPPLEMNPIEPHEAPLFEAPIEWADEADVQVFENGVEVPNDPDVLEFQREVRNQFDILVRRALDGENVDENLLRDAWRDAARAAAAALDERDGVAGWDQDGMNWDQQAAVGPMMATIEEQSEDQWSMVYILLFFAFAFFASALNLADQQYGPFPPLDVSHLAFVCFERFAWLSYAYFYIQACVVVVGLCLWFAFLCWDHVAAISPLCEDLAPTQENCELRRREPQTQVHFGRFTLRFGENPVYLFGRNYSNALWKYMRWNRFRGQMAIAPTMVGVAAESVTTLLAELHDLLKQHPGLTLLDSVLTFAWMMHRANGPLDWMTAAKVLMKDLALCSKENFEMLKKLGVIDNIQQMQIELPDEMRAVSGGDLRSIYMTNMCESVIGVTVVAVLAQEKLMEYAPRIAQMLKCLLNGRREISDVVELVIDFLKNAANYVRVCLGYEPTAVDKGSLTDYTLQVGKWQLELENMNHDPTELRREVGLLLSDVKHVTEVKTKMKDSAMVSWQKLLDRCVVLNQAVERLPASYSKPTPYYVLMVGVPGTGKTEFVIRNSWKWVASYLGVRPEAKFRKMFTRSDPKFDDGYLQDCHMMFIDDVVGHTTPSPGNTFISDLLKLLGTQVTFASNSKAELKATIPMIPAIVVQSENTMDLIPLWSKNYFALYRRANLVVEFHYKPGLDDGQEIDYDRDVFARVLTYVVPRDDHLRCGQFIHKFDCSYRELDVLIQREAAAFGKAERLKHIQRVATNQICPVCGNEGCEDPHMRIEGNEPIVPYMQAVAPEMVGTPTQFVAWLALSIIGILVDSVFLGNLAAMQSAVMGLFTSDSNISVLMAQSYAMMTFFACLPALVPLRVLATGCSTIGYIFAKWTGYSAPFTLSSYLEYGLIRVGDMLLEACVWLTPLRTRSFVAHYLLRWNTWWNYGNSKIVEFLESPKLKTLKRIALLMLSVLAIWGVLKHISGKFWSFSEEYEAEMKKLAKDEADREEFRKFKATSGVEKPGLEVVARRFESESWNADKTIMAPATSTWTVVGPGLILGTAHPLPEKRPSTAQVRRTSPNFEQNKNAVYEDLFIPADCEVQPDIALLVDRKTVLYDGDLTVESNYGLTEAEILLVDRNTFEVTPMKTPLHFLGPNHPGYKYHDGVTLIGRGSPLYEGKGIVTSGNSGSPMIIRRNGKIVVVGIVVCSDGKGTFGVAALKPETVEKWKKMRETVVDGPSVQSVSTFRAVSGASIVPAKLHPKSALSRVKPSSFLAVGRMVPEVSPTGRCTMVPTRMSSLVETTMNLPNIFHKPAVNMCPDVARGYSWGPFPGVVENVNQAFSRFKRYPEYLELAFETIQKAIRRADLPKLKPLTLRESINGTYYGLKGLTLSTSVGGFARSGPKRPNFNMETCEHYPDGKKAIEEVEARVKLILSEWKAGRHVVVEDVMMVKGDEVRKLSKPYARMISAQPFEVALAKRCLIEPLLWYLRQVKEMGFMIGKNPSGPDWKDSFDDIRKVNPNFGLDADGKAFDDSHGVEAKDFVGDAYVVTAHEAYETDEWDRAIRQCISDTTMPYTMYKGEIYVAIARFPSGTVGTSDGQSLIGWFLIRVSLCESYPEINPREIFGTDAPSVIVCMKHGGDDVAGSLGDVFMPFRAEEMQRVLKELGYIFTSDDKLHPPHIVPIEELTFYKRKFVDAGPRVWAPLDITSLSKSLHWRDSKSKIGAADQETAILECCAREFFLHGREVFETRVPQLESIARAVGLTPKFLSYDQLLELYDSRKMVVWAHTFETMSDLRTCDCAFKQHEPTAYCMCEMHCVSTQMASTDPGAALGQAEESPDAGVNMTLDDQVSAMCGDCDRVPRHKFVPVDDQGGWLTRAVVDVSGTWTPGYNVNYFPISIIQGNSYIQNRLQNYYALRGGMTITASISVPPTYMGLLVLGVNSMQIGNPTMNQLLSWDVVGYIDAASCNRVVLKVPFFMWSHALFTNSPNADGQNNLTLTLMELIPITASDGSPTDTPEVTLTFALDEPQPMIPTYMYSVAPQMVAQESKPSAVLAAVVKAAVPMTKWPVIGWGISLLSDIGSTASAVLKWFGFSSPPTLPDMQFMQVRRLPMMATGASHDVGVTMAVQPLAAQNPTRIDVEAISGDSLALSNIIRRWGYIGNFSWTSAAAVGSVLVTIPITPALCYGQGNFTPVGTSLLMFDQWSGDMEYRFIISATKFMRGRLAIFWQPNAHVPLTSYPSLSQLTPVDPLIFDLSGSATLDFIVPYGAEMPWQVTSTLTNTQTATLPTYNTRASWPINGWLVVIVVEGLAANTATVPTLQIAGLMRGGENYRVTSPTTFMAKNWYAVAPQMVGSSNVFASETKHIVHKFTGGIIIPDEILVACGGGELFHTVRSLIHRRVIHQMSIGTLANTYIAGAYVCPLFDPVMLPNATYLGRHNFNATHLGVLQCLFLGWRGTIRHTTVWSPLNSSVNSPTPGVWTSSCRVSRDQVTPVMLCAPLTNNSIGAFYYEGTNEGADVALTPTGGPDAISIAVPYCSQQYVTPCSTVSAPTCGAVTTQVMYSQPANELSVRNYIAAGDDYQVYGWLGCRTLIASVRPNNFTSSW